jgi:hypothetical protein
MRRTAAFLIGLHFFFVISVATHLHDWMSRYPLLAPITIPTYYYSAITFANRNFGFFAPQVHSDWNVRLTLTDRADHRHVEEFRPGTREMRVKLYSMTGHFTSNDDSMDLFARSWALKAMNENPNVVRVDVEVTQNRIPTMAEYRRGQRIGQEFLYRTRFDLP